MSKNYEKILKQLERKLTRLIKSMLKSGASEAAIKRAAKKLIKQFNPYSRLSKQFEKDALKVAENAFSETSKRLFWIQQHNRPKLSKKALKTLIVVNNQFALMQNKINKSVVSLVEKAIKEDISSSELSKLIAEAVGGGKYRANTIANTALQGYSAANTLEMAKNAGVKKYKYSGPPAQRQFCKSRLGKVYTYDQIQNMDNEQGLSVLYFGGGYNCPHFWEPVIDDELISELKSEGKI
jgi:hypothetical protein